MRRFAHPRSWWALVCAVALVACDEAETASDAPSADARLDAAPLDADAEAAPAPDAAPDAAPDPCRIAPPPPVEPALAAALDAALAAAFPEAAAPGVAAAVTLPDGRGWVGAVGRDDARVDAPLPPWSRFRIASVTKTFIASAVMLRVEAGLWRLDDPLDDWVPGFDLGRGVTLERLLSHTAGVYNYSDDASFILRRAERLTPTEVVEFALSHDSGLAPGEAYLYSNTGYFLLGMALEALDGRPLAAILRGDLLDPVGLGHTWLEQFEPVPDGCDIGQGHLSFDPGITEGFSATWTWAAGGLAAPPIDLCRWIRALFEGEVLPPAVVERMATPTPQSLAGEALEPYGLGLRSAVRGGRDVIGHTGSTMGFRGELFFDRATGVCVAVQTNDFTGHPIPVADALWSALP